MVKVLMPVPGSAFDPTETAVPWFILTKRGHEVIFATPDGMVGQADSRMCTGQDLGLLSSLLRADANGRAAYGAMAQSPAFQNPVRWANVRTQDFDALLLAGGHAPGMKVYLESTLLQTQVAEFFAQNKPVGAICHGVLLAARSRDAHGVSVLNAKKTTALTKQLEMSAWALTCAWLGNYYRTYPESVQAEVTRALAHPGQFVGGPMALLRDSPEHPERGFTLRDGNYLSARWPGDAHRFAQDFCAML